ncbi:DUF6906 family protein [Cohnella kolymensis]|uniref:DUF6906 family protein n=1 Tax=Cohnella kolymensis TaxID=1590652 RepID=UPI003898E36E
MSRVRGTKPTLKQAVILGNNNMDYRDWLIQRIFSDHLECVHRYAGNIKIAFLQVTK